MKISVHIAEKLLILLQGNQIAASSAKHPLIEELIEEKIIERKGRIQKKLSISNSDPLRIFLQSKYSITDLQKYIDIQKQKNVTRGELVAVSSDSKLKRVGTFKGFLVNCYSPIQAILNEEKFTVNPTEGAFQFIYDFEKFIIPQDITIVGIENSENFRRIKKQKYLFENIQPLFVNRYPQSQSKDLIKWLRSIPNNYLHFGDFDLAGIGIYLNEYKKYLTDKAMFLIPENIEKFIANSGNTALYDNQKETFDQEKINENQLKELIRLIHKHKKGLEQEIFIKN
jgi:hypothetical protein